MKKVLGFLILSLLLNSISYADLFRIGQKINNELKITRHFKIPLSSGDWEVVRRQTMSAWGIKQRIIGIVKLKNNEIVEMIEVYDGELRGKRISDIDQAINEIVFKNKYDGCYDRPEYYHLELFRKGRVHNCLIVRHWDTEKELYRPDDPEYKGVARLYRNWISENSITFPKISLTSEHSYFSRHSGGNWYRVIYVMNPKLLSAPKNKYYGEENSEYHKFNIENYPNHKKIMNKWMSISSKRHIEFENYNKAKKTHKLNLNQFILDFDNVKKSRNDENITEQIIELNKLYKEGILTKEEFEKAKKKILN